MMGTQHDKIDLIQIQKTIHEVEQSINVLCFLSMLALLKYLGIAHWIGAIVHKLLS